jgi:NAD(P)-dependent dehydrogenase (short-subunit alcohol dehydrogenase family)
MARDEDVERACAELLEWKGRCDILVANAGAAGTRVPLVEWSRAEWDAAFELNVRGTFVLIQSLDAALRKSPAGRAVFLTTAAVRKLPPGAGAYAVSKAALEAMVRLYAKETQGGSLTVTLVDPGPTRTAMRAGAYPREDPDAVKPAEALAPLFLQLAVEGKPGGGELVVADDWLAARVPAGN